MFAGRPVTGSPDQARQAARHAALAAGRPASVQVGSTEAELVAAGCGSHVTRLEASPRTLLDRMATLGTVVAITRNASAALEMRGTLARPSREARLSAGTVPLQLRSEHWRHVFAVRHEHPGRSLRTLAVFAEDGSAVHEVVVRDAAQVAAFDAVVADLASPDQSTHLAILPIKRLPERRVEALRLAGPGRAWSVALWSLGALLERSATEGEPVAVSVSNAGARQRWAGQIRSARQVGQSAAVLDESARLHLRAGTIAQAWVIRDWVPEGSVSTLELLDREGETVLRVGAGGGRDDGRWLSLIDRLERRW